MAPNGHSTVQRRHLVQLLRLMRGNERSPLRGCSARPSTTLRIAWIAFSAAPVASSAASDMSMGRRSGPQV
jgi:hypothetical protein